MRSDTSKPTLLARAQSVSHRARNWCAERPILATSVAITCAMGVMSWLLGGQPPLVGIDDAAITRSYSENIANGHGFVYNIGGERVEGATSFLWTLIVALAYAVSSSPAFLIYLMCAVATVAATFAALKLALHFAEVYALPQGVTHWSMVVVLAGLPGFYMWTTLSLMEVAVWSCVLLWLVLRCVEWVDGKRQSDGWMMFAAAVMALLRPEGVAMAVGLLGLTAVLAHDRLRTPLLAIAASIGAFVSLTVFRLFYFGFPFPNTYYAKVSADRLQNLMDGMKYILTYLLDAPGAQLFIIAWLILVAIVVAGLWRKRSFAGGGILIPAAAVFGVLATYAALGGDHFVHWRFLAPIMPIAPLACVLAISWFSAGILARQASVTNKSIAFCMLAAGWFAVSYINYYQSRFDIFKEFEINNRGIEFGTAFNSVRPVPTIGVGAAGGIALAYDGTIRDLLGLNWTAMAHANPIKIGMRNHASFDSGVFWSHRPDVVALFNRQCPAADGSGLLWHGGFNGLYVDKRFRTEYVPVLYKSGGECWPLIASKPWLDKLDNRKSFTILEWSQFMSR